MLWMQRRYRETLWKEKICAKYLGNAKRTEEENDIGRNEFRFDMRKEEMRNISFSYRDVGKGGTKYRKRGRDLLPVRLHYLLREFRAC